MWETHTLTYPLNVLDQSVLCHHIYHIVKAGHLFIGKKTHQGLHQSVWRIGNHIHHPIDNSKHIFPLRHLVYLWIYNCASLCCKIYAKQLTKDLNTSYDKRNCNNFIIKKFSPLYLSIVPIPYPRLMDTFCPRVHTASSLINRSLEERDWWNRIICCICLSVSVSAREKKLGGKEEQSCDSSSPIAKWGWSDGLAGELLLGWAGWPNG